MTGRDKASDRRATLADLAAGEIDILVGTHALFQEAVMFRDLGLAVVRLVAQAHGGTARFVDGPGATLRITIPHQGGVPLHAEETTSAG